MNKTLAGAALPQDAIVPSQSITLGLRWKLSLSFNEGAQAVGAPSEDHVT